MLKKETGTFAVRVMPVGMRITSVSKKSLFVGNATGFVQVEPPSELIFQPSVASQLSVATGS